MRSLHVLCVVALGAGCADQSTGPATLATNGGPTIAMSAYVVYPNTVRLFVSPRGEPPPASGVIGMIWLSTASAGLACDVQMTGDVHRIEIEVAVPFVSGGVVQTLDQALSPGDVPVIALGSLGSSIPSLTTMSAGITDDSTPTQEMASGTLTLTSVSHDGISGRFDASAATTRLVGEFSAPLCDLPPQ